MHDVQEIEVMEAGGGVGQVWHLNFSPAREVGDEAHIENQGAMAVEMAVVETGQLGHGRHADAFGIVIGILGPRSIRSRTASDFLQMRQETGNDAPVVVGIPPQQDFGAFLFGVWVVEFQQPLTGNSTVRSGLLNGLPQVRPLSRRKFWLPKG